MGKIAKDSKSYITDFLICAFPKLDAPQSFQGQGAAKYSVQLLLPKSKKDVVKEITAWVQSQIVNSKLTKQKQDEASKRSLKNNEDDFFLFKDGDSKDTEKYPFFKGNWVLNVKRPEKWGPCVALYPDGSFIPDALLGSEIYGGAVVRCKIGVYVFEQPKPGATLQLLEIQKVKDGESHKAASELDAIEDLSDDTFDAEAVPL